MFEGSRGTVLSRSTTCARVFGVCAIAVLAAFSMSADAQIPVSYLAPSELDSSSAAPLADPSVATDGAGNWVAAWSSNMGAGNAQIVVATSSDNGVTWSTPTAITAVASDHASPSLATNGTVWVLAWTVGGNVEVATSNNSGATWTGPAAQGTGTSPAVGVNNAGVWVAAAADGGDIVTDNSLAQSASAGAAGADTPAIATNGSTNWVIAFTTATGIGIVSSNNNGQSWSAITSRGGVGDAGPFVGFDPDINAFVVAWNTATGISAVVSTNNGGTWSAAAEIITGGISTEPLGGATDGNGAWTLVFGNTNNDVAFSTSTNNGLTWSSPRLIADTTTSDGNPSIATDGAGQWITLWDAIDGPLVRVLLATAVTTTATGAGDGSGSDGPCFIASAAYGTPMAKDIEVLRQMRDTYLMSNALGLFFVDAYYSVSPVIADQVAQHPWLAGVVRALLIPVLFVVELFMRAPVPFLLMALFGAGMIVRRRMATRRAA